MRQSLRDLGYVEGRNLVLEIRDTEMSGKQLQLLREVKPNLTRVAVLGDRAVNELVLTSPLLFTSLVPIAETAITHRLPAINLFIPFFAEAGGLLAYGPTFGDLFRSAAGYVDRILKGARAGDLPVQRPTRFEFIVNLRTASALNLEMPKALLARADRVIT